MNRLLLVTLTGVLLLPGCAVRGGSGGGDDDDDDGGVGSSTAWVRTSYSDDGETDYDHELWLVNLPSACAAVRASRELFTELNAIADAEYDQIVEEFGGTEGPGAQEALCESERSFYAGFADADLALYRPGIQTTVFSVGGFEGANPLQIPPGPYTDWNEADEQWYYGWRSRMDSWSWLEAWDELDCSDLDAYESMGEGIDSGFTYWDLAGGTLWVSNPSSSQTDLRGEDIKLIDDNENESNFTLDAEFPLCEVSGD